MDVKNNIILAMDVPNINDAMELMDKISDYIDTVKIGYPLVLAEGLESVSKIKKEYNCRVICDFKVADIPATNKKIADVTFQSVQMQLLSMALLDGTVWKAVLNLPKS